MKRKKAEAKSGAACDIRPKGDSRLGPNHTVNLDHQHPRAQPIDTSYENNKTHDIGDGKRKMRRQTHASSSLENGYFVETNTTP